MSADSVIRSMLRAPHPYPVIRNLVKINLLLIEHMHLTPLRVVHVILALMSVLRAAARLLQVNTLK